MLEVEKKIIFLIHFRFFLYTKILINTYVNIHAMCLSIFCSVHKKELELSIFAQINFPIILKFSLKFFMKTTKISNMMKFS